MPQLQGIGRPSFVRHLLCPGCLTPMHIRLAEVAEGREIIQYACNRCDAQSVRNSNSSPARVIRDTMK